MKTMSYESLATERLVMNADYEQMEESGGAVLNFETERSSRPAA